MALKDDLVVLLDLGGNAKNEEVVDAVSALVEEAGSAATAGASGAPISPDDLADALGNVIALYGHRGGLHIGEPGGESIQDTGKRIADAYHVLLAKREEQAAENERRSA